MNFDTTKYTVWTWKNPLVLHWILNPALFVNELLLGQRVPKVMLIEKSNKPLAERSFVPCPHCATIHPALKWSPQNNTAFKNWFGLYCDHYTHIIPCVINLTSCLLLGLTFPLWIGFKDRWKERWLACQKDKFAKPLNFTQPAFNWRYAGLCWGSFMYVFSTVLLPLIGGEGITARGLLIGIPVWTVGGLMFEYFVKKMAGKYTRQIATKTTGRT